MIFKEIKAFIQELLLHDKATWKDEFGNFKVVYFNNFYKKWSKFNDCKVIKSHYIKIPVDNIGKYDKIITIGGFLVHNMGKIEAEKLNKKLITIPVPLSNDSFGTNRCSSGADEKEASYECVFPNKVVFDLELLTDIGVEKNIYGFGEYTGLYFSIIDYYLKTKKSPDIKLLNYITTNFFEIFNFYINNNYEEFLKRLSAMLVFKCIVMRSNLKHEIGCGIDHSFARVLEIDYGMNHGRSVYLGCILSSVLFPEWEIWGLSTTCLVDVGLKLNVIVPSDINLLKNVNVKELIAKAITVRKKRRTMLNNLSAERISENFHLFKSSYNGVY